VLVVSYTDVDAPVGLQHRGWCYRKPLYSAVQPSFRAMVCIATNTFGPRSAPFIILRRTTCKRASAIRSACWSQPCALQRRAALFSTPRFLNGRAATDTLTSSGNVAVAARSPATAPQAMDAPGDSSFRFVWLMYTFFRPAEAHDAGEVRPDILKISNTEPSPRQHQQARCSSRSSSAADRQPRSNGGSY